MGQAMNTPDDLTTPEVWRDLQVFMARYDTDRNELLSAIGEIKTMIANQKAVTPNELELSQAAQDTETATLKAAVAQLEDKLEERTRTSRQVLLSAAASLVVLVLGALVVAGLQVPAVG